MDPAKEALILVRNLIRVGQVNTVNETDGTVQVLFEDRDNFISGDLPMFSFEYDMPEPGEQAVCLFLGNGIEQGYCLGTPFSNVKPPPVKDANLYHKKFGDGTFIQFNKASNELEIHSSKPLTLKGDFVIEGNVNVNGNISAKGSVTGSNIGS
jgi:phage baseplate assembly protein V